MRVLITGASGGLGQEVSKLFPYAYKPTRQEMPIEESDVVRSYVEKHGPFDVLIHLAAMTGIPKCENDRQGAFAVNQVGTWNVCSRVRWNNPEAYLLYMSTPCVFSGDEGQYWEWSIPYPRNFYGFSKSMGEQVVISFGGQYVIVRANFVPYRPFPHKYAFEDRYGTYLFAHQVASALQAIIEQRKVGTIHVVGDRILSMFDLAKLCPESQHVLPMTLKDYTGTEHLTKNMVLESSQWPRQPISGPK